MEFKKEKKGKFVKRLCYFLLYVIVGIWIILSLFFSKSLDINFTFIITLKITDWIILFPIVLLVPLMFFIQIKESKKLSPSFGDIITQNFNRDNRDETKRQTSIKIKYKWKTNYKF